MPYEGPRIEPQFDHADSGRLESDVDLRSELRAPLSSEGPWSGATLGAALMALAVLGVAAALAGVFLTDLLR
jgi:hypothetical protein